MKQLDKFATCQMDNWMPIFEFVSEICIQFTCTYVHTHTRYLDTQIVAI